jgi:hypothetical protein
MMETRSLPFDRAARMLVAACAVVIVALAGCRPAGQPIWPVSGKVTLRGEPAAGTALRFTDESRRIDMTASVQSDGSYEVVTARGHGLPQGTYAVSVITAPIAMPLGPALDATPPPRTTKVAARYLQAATSGISLKVEPRPNRLDVVLE